MICYSIRLLKIRPDKAAHVVATLRRDGLLAELKKQVPGHIGCSILESDLTNDLYLVIDFWQSQYDFFESEISPCGIFLTGVLDRLAHEHASLGPFSFPPSPDALAQALSNHAIASTPEGSSAVEGTELARR